MKTGFKTIVVLAIVAGLSCFWFANRHHDAPSVDELQEIYRLSRKLEGLHQAMGPVRSGDWLDSHDESGQTFRDYANSRPIKLSEQRNVLYVLPLGEFDDLQMKIVNLSAEFLQDYFMCEVKTLDVQSLDIIPARARRVHPSWGVRQINSRYVLNKVLPPMLPDDAVALIAFSSTDLYPEDDWNFVFGQASLKNRVGVWSIFRNGDPETEFSTVLRRTIRTATHETGHMFSIEHCIAYECNMCGSNNREESDRHPTYMCPECVSKVWWATDCDPHQRFVRLDSFCKENGLQEEALYYSKAAKSLTE